jgi:hypothetical protein
MVEMLPQTLAVAAAVPLNQAEIEQVVMVVQE